MSNLKQDLSQIEAVLATIGTLQGVVLPLVSGIPTASKVASGIFGAVSVLAICIQKLVAA
jgi:hypothetical protein